jgi:hypothetical protein
VTLLSTAKRARKPKPKPRLPKLLQPYKTQARTSQGLGHVQNTSGQPSVNEARHPAPETDRSSGDAIGHRDRPATVDGETVPAPFRAALLRGIPELLFQRYRRGAPLGSEGAALNDTAKPGKPVRPNGPRPAAGSVPAGIPVLRHRGVTRAGRADFCPSVGVTAPTPRPRVGRRPASVRGESSRNRITPGSHGLVSVPSRGALRRAGVHTHAPGRARRRSLSSSGTRAFRSAFASRLRLLPLGRRAPWPSGITPGGPASRNGGFHRDRGAREDPELHRLECVVQTPVTTSTVGITLRRDREVHAGCSARRSPSAPDRSGARAWLAGPKAASEGVCRSVHTSRGRPHTPSRCYPAGVPIRLLSGVVAVTGRARRLAEQIVDRLALFAPRGPLPPACDQRGIADPRAPLPERPEVVVTMMKRKLSMCAADCSSPLGEETLDLSSRQGSYPIARRVSTPIF